MFLISLHEIKPYLDGCKVAINIGNPTNVLYSGFKAKVKWGKRWEEGINYDDWVKQLREKEESFTEELKPGWWNKAVVTVSPAKPDQLGYLEFSIETNNAKLFDNRK